MTLISHGLHHKSLKFLYVRLSLCLPELLHKADLGEDREFVLESVKKANFSSLYFGVSAENASIEELNRCWKFFVSITGKDKAGNRYVTIGFCDRNKVRIDSKGIKTIEGKRLALSLRYFNAPKWCYGDGYQDEVVFTVR